VKSSNFKRISSKGRPRVERLTSSIDRDARRRQAAVERFALTRWVTNVDRPIATSHTGAGCASGASVPIIAAASSASSARRSRSTHVLCGRRFESQIENCRAETNGRRPRSTGSRWLIADLRDLPTIASSLDIV
jgi:hypothetical protein